MRWHGQRGGGADDEIDLEILAQQIALRSDGSDDAVIRLGAIATQLKTTSKAWIHDIQNVARVLQDFDKVIVDLRGQTRVRLPVQERRPQPSASRHSKRPHRKLWPEDKD